jgi:S1-C subfamily serine protease
MSPQKPGSALTELSSQLAGAVESAASAVVAIHARRRIPSSGIVWRDGVIVAASHTVRRDDAIPVTLPSGASAVATIAGRDPVSDIIALRVNSAQSPAASRADADSGRVGSLVLAVGRPGGAVSASFGVISAIREGWRSSWGTRIDRVLRLDLAIYDGFSGGPLVAASGGVIGMNTSALARGTPTALPAAAVDRVLDELLERGSVRRAFIGIAVQPVALGAAVVKRLQLARDTALVVLSIADGSPAETAGLSVGDVLIDANGQPLNRPADLLDVLSTVPEGGTVNLKHVRGAAVATVTVTPVDRGGGAGGGATRE